MPELFVARAAEIRPGYTVADINADWLELIGRGFAHVRNRMSLRRVCVGSLMANQLLSEQGELLRTQTEPLGLTSGFGHTASPTSAAQFGPILLMLVFRPNGNAIKAHAMNVHCIWRRGRN
jgi:hypothetical protein